MKRHALPLLLLAAVATACRSTGPAGPPEGASSARPVEAGAPAPDAARAAEGRDAKVAAPAPARSTAASEAPEVAQDPSDLGIWQDPAFRRRIAESYLSETEVEPRLTGIERERMQEILDRIALGDRQGAEQMLVRYGGEGTSAVFDVTLGTLRYEAGDEDAALAAYERAVAKFPKFRRAWKQVGLVRVQRSDFAGAAEALARVVELGGNDSLTYGLLGFARSNLKQPLAAELAYRMAMMLDAETEDWKLGLARSLFEQQRFADAVALTEHMIADDPSRPSIWKIQAQAYLGQGERLRAAENFEFIDRLGAASVEDLQLLGNLYIDQRLFDLAVDAYERAIAKDEEGYAAKPIQAARVLLSRGAAGATRKLVRSIELGYGDRLAVDQRKDLLRLRAQLALRDGAGGEEAAVLQEIVELDPLDGEALIALGQHASRSEDPEQAIFYFERAASLEDFEADAKVRHAQLLARQGKYAEALPLLRRAQAIEPRDNIQDYLEQVERAAQGR